MEHAAAAPHLVCRCWFIARRRRLRNKRVALLLQQAESGDAACQSDQRI